MKDLGDQSPTLDNKVGLLSFVYHLYPVATGNMRLGPKRCACCGHERGYVYTASVYGQHELRNQLCSWCIADGPAAEKFDVMFSDDHALVRAGVAREIIQEVTRRNPGYVSWQGEDWQSCCQDACEFHGDIGRQELLMIDPTTVEQLLAATRWSPADGQKLVATYKLGGSPAIYHFVCRHCRKPKLTWDCD